MTVTRSYSDEKWSTSWKPDMKLSSSIQQCWLLHWYNYRYVLVTFISLSLCFLIVSILRMENLTNLHTCSRFFSQQRSPKILGTGISWMVLTWIELSLRDNLQMLMSSLKSFLRVITQILDLGDQFWVVVRSRGDAHIEKSPLLLN